MIEKVKIIYKGDIFTSYYYLGFGLFLCFVSVLLYLFTVRIGWLYLSIGLGLLGLFCIGKASMIYLVSKNRFKYYQSYVELNDKDRLAEIEYNLYRLQKKEHNRRRYIYSVGVGFILLILGFFIGEKGLAIGTLVPIILYAGTEFGVSLLTEFRLWEYQRQLEKKG